MVHTIRLSSTPPFPIINVHPIHSYPSILSKTVQSPFRSIISVPSNPIPFHLGITSRTSLLPYISTTACHVSSFLPSIMVHVACELPLGDTCTAYVWRVHGRYITELDIHGYTCMAYAGRDCGIHWLGRVYLTGLGEETDKLDSMDDLDDWMDGWYY